MAAVAESPIADGLRIGRALNGAESHKLDQHGVLTLADGGVLHRPTPDAPRPVPQPDGLCTAAELTAVRAAFDPLAAVECEQRVTDEKARDARATGHRGKAADFAARTDMLKADHAKVRGTARVAYLSALDAATHRAAAEYTAAAYMLADTAAKYQGLASMRDSLIGNRITFDPLGLWGMVPCLLAPDLAHRPRGWCVVHDAYGRELLWHGQSPAHLDAMRRVQAEFKAELEPFLAGARWPF